MTRLMLVKLLRDIRASWSRIVLMVVAVSVSLIVLGAVVYARTIVDREFDRNYRGTVPASATLVLEPGLAPQRLAEVSARVATRPGVAEATLRTQFTAQLRAPGGAWSKNPLQVFVSAADDPMRMARFDIEQGTWPPPDDGILIERGALQFLGLRVGDPIVVKPPGREPVTLTVTGVAHDPSLAAARQEQKGYGYVTTTSSALGGQATLDQLKIVVPAGDRDAIVKVARDLASWAAPTFGQSVDEIQVPPPFRQPHQSWMDLILRVLLVFGAMVLALSAVLAAAMLNRLLTGQTPQIGIMKAIGARSGRITLFYLAMVLLIAAAATAIAVVPGLALGRSLALTLLTGYDMDMVSSAVPWWTYTVVIASGLGLPLLAMLPPVLRASRSTVRQAMTEHGARTVVKTRLKTFDRALSMALRNMFRRKGRLLLLVGLLATAGALFTGAANTLSGMDEYERQAIAQQRWDVAIQLADPAPIADLTRIVTGVPGVSAVETWTITSISAARDTGRTTVTDTYPDQGHGARFMAAIPPQTSSINPTLLEGRWLRPGDTEDIILNRGERGGLFPQTRLGDTVRLLVDGQPTTWRVAGFVKQRLGGPAAFVTTEGFAAATRRTSMANELRIVTETHDSAGRATVAQETQRALAAASLEVTQAQPVDRVEGVIDGHMYLVQWVLLLLAVIMAVIGSVSMASTMSAGVLERLREFAIMHAIGARPWAVRRIVVAEGICTSLLGLLIAITPAIVLTYAMNIGLGAMLGGDALPFRVSTPAVLTWIAIALVGAILATLAPAFRASRLTVREALTRL